MSDTPTPAQADEKALDTARKVYNESLNLDVGALGATRRIVEAYLAAIRPAVAPIAWTGQGSLAAIAEGRNGTIYPEPPSDEGIALFASPPAPAGVKVRELLEEIVAMREEGDCKTIVEAEMKALAQKALSLLPPSMEAQTPAASSSGSACQSEDAGQGAGAAIAPASAKPASEPAGDGVRTGRRAIVHAVVCLGAAISLLERTPKAKKAAPSDRMFDQMLRDYRKALEEASAALSSPASSSPAEAEALPDGVDAAGWLYDQEVGNIFKSRWKTEWIAHQPGEDRGIRNIRQVFTLTPPATGDGAGAVPAGWQLVPIEPTDAMLKPFGGRHAPNGGSNRAGYRAMLAASPAPAPAVGVENLMQAVRRAEDGAGSLPARDAVKLRPADWHAVCDAARKLASPKAGETGNG